jgi:hypothetical protein
MSGRLFDERKHAREHTLSFDDLIAALRVRGVPFGRSGVRDEDAERSRAARRAPANRVK